jgi:DNA-binding transcriptional MerR regulator
MNTRSSLLNVSIVTTRPSADVHLSFEQLAEAAGLSAVDLGRLVHLGLIEPDVPDTHEFTADTAARLRRMLRLHRDLGVNLTGAAIIVDLLERVERLEARLVDHAGG